MKLLRAAIVSTIIVLVIVLLTDVGNCQAPHGYGVGYGHVNNYVQQNDVIIGIPIAPDYYYSVGEGETPEERNAKIADEVIKRFEEKFKINGGNAQPEAPRQPEGVNRNLFRLIGGTPEKAESTLPAPDVPEIERSVLNLFNGTCVKCHKPGASKPGRIQLLTADRKLFGESEQKKEYARRIRVYESVESGEMPKNGPVLTASQKALLLEWMNLAKPKN